MLADHSSITLLYGAVMLPLLVLYVLIFSGFTARDRKRFGSTLGVSLRDAAVATLALDLSALVDLLPILFEPLFGRSFGREAGLIPPLVIVGIATAAHVIAFQFILRREDWRDHKNGPDSGPFAAALEKLDAHTSRPFLVRLSSLYFATVLLLTNGTTMLAVLELVRTAR